MLDGQRIGIVLLSAIGDIVHALPLAESLRSAAPGARIEWFAQPVPAELLEGHPAVDRVWLLDRARGWRAFRDIRTELRGERFDLVIDAQVYTKASIVTALIDSPRKLGFDRARARELNWVVTNERLQPRPDAHMCDQFLEFADYLGVERKYTWNLPISADERAAQARFFGSSPGPVAALVVGTTRRAKEWPATRWAGLAEGLSEMGYRVCIVGGTSDNESAVADEIRVAADCRIDDVRENNLRRLVWLLDGASLVVSCDTGPYHLAVALDVPTIGLYGYTDPARVGPGSRYLDLVVDAFHDPGEPWHPVHRTYRSGRMERIEIADVMGAVRHARERYPRAGGPGAVPS